MKERFILGATEANYYVSHNGMQIAAAAAANSVLAQGYYTCSVTNPVNGQTRESKPIQLMIDGIVIFCTTWLL